MKHSPLTILGLTALAGCAAPSGGSNPEPASRTKGGSGQVLQVDGQSVVLGQVAASPLPLQVFVARLQQASASGREDDMRDLVRTYPDLAEQAVFSPGATTSQQTTAAWLDGFATPAKGGWALFAADRAENPERYSNWEQQRTAAWVALRRGEFAEVADRALAVPSDGPTPWPDADARTLRATAMMAAGRPADAAELFERAAALTADWDARYAARARLFASLGHSLAGEIESAATARASAVAGLSLESVHDPMLLRLLLETQEPAAGSTSEFSSRAMRARLGRVEMEREAPQAALLAWRAAETELGTEPSRDRLRLGQAEALIALGQVQPAIAMLAGLAQSDVRSEALAMLGLVQMRRGQVDIALAIFREAVETTSSNVHPGVFADAGLALLSTGNRDAGLSLLHEARDVYMARGDTGSLRRLLHNELRFAQAVDDSDLANDARQRLLDANL